MWTFHVHMVTPTCFLHVCIKWNSKPPSLITLDTWSCSKERTTSLACISCHNGIRWGPFGLRGTHFHHFMYPCFPHWSSLHTSTPMQNSQKYAYFLVSIANISPVYFLYIEFNSLVPYIALQYQGMDLFTYPSSTFQKNLCTDFICLLPA